MPKMLTDTTEIATFFGALPSKKNHYRAATDKSGRAYIYKDEWMKQAEQAFRDQPSVYAGRMINQPFTLYAAIYTNNPLVDVDGVVTSLLDALQDIRAITDDNLCRKLIVEKRRGKPKIMYAIEPIKTPGLFD